MLSSRRSSRGLTERQKYALRWIAVDEPEGALVGNGYELRTVLALARRGLVERNPDDRRRWRRTEAGREATTDA